MDNPRVNLYIETTIHGPAQKGGRWMYLPEYVTSSGERRTKKEAPETIGPWEDSTENELVLKALLAGLANMKQPCDVEVYTSNRFVCSAIMNDWITDWQQLGWKKADGKPLKYAELWEGIAKEMERHLVTATAEPHSFRNWMQARFKWHSDNILTEGEKAAAF